MPAMSALAPLVAFFVAALAAGLLLHPAARRFALDMPNERSLHSQPVPRTGGIAIAAAIVAASLAASALPGSALVIAAALAVISFADDVMNLPTALRLAMHLAAAGAVVALQLDLPFMGALLLALAIAWMANAYNFMDGADGLAAGMAVVGFGAYALARFLSGFLFGVAANDVLTLAAVAALLAAVATLASYVAARRATKVDPLVALRAE